MSQSKKRKTIFKIYQAISIELLNLFMIESLLEISQPIQKGDLMKQKRMLSFLVVLWSSSLLHSEFVNISDEDQYKNIVSGHKQMIVKFSADWCSVCNGIKKPFEEIAQEAEFQNVAFAQVDVDKLDNLSKQNGIVGVPTFVYVEDGAKKIEEIGVQNMPSFKDHLRTNIRKTFQVTQNNKAMNMTTDQQPSNLTAEETITVEETPMATPVEPNIFMRIINGIKNFIVLVLSKVKEFFMTIVDAIKGFFGS